MRAFSLAPTSAAAEWNDDDIALGLFTLFVLGAAIHEARDNDHRPAPQTNNPRPNPPQTQQPQNSNRWVVPAQCRRNFETRQGNVRLFTRNCMQTNWTGNINRLPDHCYSEIRTTAGQTRRGWVPRCLAQAGYVASDRR